jgi:hypothetical protein
MRGNRFWAWAVAALLWVVCVPIVRVANADARSVLVVHSGDYPEIEQVRAELLALDFRVTLLNDHQASSSPARLVEAARETGASVAIEFVVVVGSLQVWLFDAATGNPPTLQQFRYGATSNESARVQALGVVEYLRAALIQSEVRAASSQAPPVPSHEQPWPIAEPPTPGEKPKQAVAGGGTPAFVARSTPAAPSVLPPRPSSKSYPRPPSLWLALAPGVAGLDGLSVLTPCLAPGVVWQAMPDISLSIHGLLPLYTSNLRSKLGATELSTWGMWALADYNLAPTGSRWRPTLGAGLAVLWLDLLGRPVQAGKSRREVQAVVPAPAIEFELHWQALESLAVFGSLRAAYPIPKPRIEFAEHDVSDLGRPAIFLASLGVEWRAVAWARRD